MFKRPWALTQDTIVIIIAETVYTMFPDEADGTHNHAW